MDKIKTSIFGEHKLINQGIASLLGSMDSVEIIEIAQTKEQLFQILKTSVLHVLIIHVTNFDTLFFNFIQQIINRYPKTKIIILTSINNQDIIQKCIKVGANGVLSNESSSHDLLEAIISVRSGFEYFSKSITQILLNQYISKIKETDNSQNPNNLSTREVEVLKLWGNNFSNNEIADQLCISIRTVESHKNHIMQKLNIKTNVELLKYAIKNNIVEIF